ncbi:PH domain-containing protein [Streptomyces daliensis]
MSATKAVGDGTAAPDTSATSEGTWHAPDPRTLAVHVSWLAAPLASTLATVALGGGRVTAGTWITLGSVAATFLVITALGLARWRTTRYRVTDTAFELRTGLLGRSLRRVPLHRVRSIDLYAHPVHRLFGLTVLRVGTAGSASGGGSGTGASGELRLEALTRADAERLRKSLLAHPARTAGAGTETGAGADGAASTSASTSALAPASDTVLATADWRRLRYAPLTFWVFGGVLTVLGTAWRVLDGMGVEPWRLGPVRRAATAVGGSPWLLAPAALLVTALVGAVGAVVLAAENWWRYRLEWTGPATLRIRRGLLTTRSVSIERTRLHGVALREPLLLRAAGGASVRAIAGGLGNREENRSRSVLLPPASRTEALGICAAVLTPPGGTPEAPTPERLDTGSGAAPRLTPHPRPAFRRRLLRGLGWAVAPVSAVLALLAALLDVGVLWHCAWGYAAVAVPAGWWLARDAARGLGHGVAGSRLLIRSGTFSRDLVALRRESVLSWTFTGTPLSRRAGLLSVTAGVAGGEDGYRIPDMSAHDAVAFAHAAAPGILDDFLVPNHRAAPA